MFSLGVRAHTIEEAIRLFKVWFFTISNKELKVYKVILESIIQKFDFGPKILLIFYDWITAVYIHGMTSPFSLGYIYIYIYIKLIN